MTLLLGRGRKRGGWDTGFRTVPGPAATKAEQPNVFLLQEGDSLLPPGQSKSSCRSRALGWHRRQLPVSLPPTGCGRKVLGDFPERGRMGLSAVRGDSHAWELWRWGN